MKDWSAAPIFQHDSTGSRQGCSYEEDHQKLRDEADCWRAQGATAHEAEPRRYQEIRNQDRENFMLKC